MKKLIVSIFLLALLVVAAFANPYGVSRWGYSSGASGVGESWSYRVPLIVANDGAERTDHVVWFDLSSNDSVVAHAKSDGSDLRCRNEHGQSLYHWWRSDTNWVIGVKCDTIEASSTDTVGYCFYGDASASSTSNGDSTFQIFGDFLTDFTFEDLDSARQVWQDTTGTVIANGSDGEWDDIIREIGNVVAIAGTLWMCYSGHDHATPEGGDSCSIGVAYSVDDGYTWTKWGGNPVLAHDASHGFEDGYMVYCANGNVFLYAEHNYGSGSSRIVITRSVSTDSCKTFTEIDTSFAPKAGGQPDGWQSNDVSSPAVYLDISDSDTSWYCAYEGRSGANGKIGIGASKNGITWTQLDDTCCLGRGEPGEWDDKQVVPDDFYLGDDGTIYFSYHGESAGAFECGIAWANSIMGTYTRIPYNPIVSEAGYGLGGSLMFYSESQDSIHLIPCYYTRNGNIVRGYPIDTTNGMWAYSSTFDFVTQGGANHKYMQTYAKDGVLYLFPRWEETACANIKSVRTMSNADDGISVEVRRKVHTGIAQTDYYYMHMSLGRGGDCPFSGEGNWNQATLDTALFCWMPRYDKHRHYEMDNCVGTNRGEWPVDSAQSFNWHIDRVCFTGHAASDTAFSYVDGVEKEDNVIAIISNQDIHAHFSQGSQSSYNKYPYQAIDWVIGRKFSRPEPTGSVGAEEDNP